MRFRTLIAIAISSSLCAGGLAHATTVPAVGALPSLAVQAGDYNFTQFDKGVLQKAVIEKIAQYREADAEYVKNSVNAIEVALSDFLANEINGAVSKSGVAGIQTLADLSVTERLSIQDFLAAVRAYRQAILQIENKIKSVTALPSTLDPKNNVTVNESGIVNFPELGQVDFSKIIAHYQEQLKKIDAQVAKLKVSVLLPGNRIEELDVNADISKIYTADELNKLRKKIALDRARDPQIDQIIDQFNVFTVGFIRKTQEVYGTSQILRLQLNEEGRDSSMDEINSLFFARSLLRLTYGAQIGALIVDGYKLRKANLDFFSTTNHLKFSNAVVRSKNDLTEYQNTLANALVTYESRNKEILARDTSLLNRLASAFVFVQGKSQLAQVNAMMVKLLLADIEEEIIVQSGDLRKLRDRFRSRYLFDDTSKAFYKEKKDLWLSSSTSATQSDDPFAGPSIAKDTVDPESPRGAFNLAKVGLDSYNANFYQARQAELALQEIEKNNVFKQATDKREKAVNDLFK